MLLAMMGINLKIPVAMVLHNSGAPKEQYDLIFRDSKDKNFPLIQIADIFAGTIRTYNENCLPLKAHNQYCKICFSSSVNEFLPMLAA